MNVRRIALAGLTLATLTAFAFACGGDSGNVTPATPAPAPAPEPEAPAASAHGMVIYGVGTKFVSLMPGRGDGARQLIAEVKLLRDPETFDAGLFATPHPSGYHTLETRPFAVADLRTPGFRVPATLYAGHYQDDDRVKIGDVVIEVERLILDRLLPASAEHRPVYPAFVFGDIEAGEFYMAHLIGAPPSFQQITLIAEGALSGNPDWEKGTVLDATVHSDQPIARYGDFSLQVESSPLRVKTRAVYTRDAGR